MMAINHNIAVKYESVIIVNIPTNQNDINNNHYAFIFTLTVSQISFKSSKYLS